MPRTNKKKSTHSHIDLGLLLLRFGLGLSMLALHTVPHLIHFEQESNHFIPLIGLDHKTTLVVTILTEGCSSILIILGYQVRLAALALSCAMTIAFVLVHGASFQGEQSGELSFLYLLTSLTLTLTGPGRYALNLHKS